MASGNGGLAALWPQIDLVCDARGGMAIVRRAIHEAAILGRFSQPGEWKTSTFKALGEFLGGSTPSKNVRAYWDGDIPWVSPKDMKAVEIVDSEDHVSRSALEDGRLKLVPPGSVLMVVRSGILRRTIPVALTRSACTINQDMKALVPARGVSPAYVRVIVKGLERRILAEYVKGGTTVQSVIWDALMQLEVSLPPLAEQKRIVATVDHLMALCDELEAKQTKERDVGDRLTKAALGALALAETADEATVAWRRVAENFEALFKDTESVEALRETALDLAMRGRLTSRLPEDGLAAVLLDHLAKERSARVVRTPKAAPPVREVPFDLPKSWVWERLDRLWQSITDGDHQPPPKEVSGVAFLTIGNVSKGFLDFSQTRYVSRGYFDGLDKARVPLKGDLLYTVVGSFGTPVVVTTPREFCVQRHIAILRPLPSTNVAWMYYWMRSGFIYRQAKAMATGIAQPTVGLASLRSFIIPVPPKAEQMRIVRTLDSLMNLCDDLEAKLCARDKKAARLAEALVAKVAVG